MDSLLRKFVIRSAKNGCVAWRHALNKDLFMLEVLLELLGELIIQVIGELFAHFFVNMLADPLRPANERSPVLSFFGYVSFGLILGGISLLAFPHSFIHFYELRLANLFVSPVLAGFMMSMVGRWRVNHAKNVIRLDSFSYGFAFALALAAIRFRFAT